MRPFATAAFFALLPAAASAHEGHHGQMSALAVARHVLTQPDHLLAIGGLCALAAAFAWSLQRRPARIRVRR